MSYKHYIGNSYSQNQRFTEVKIAEEKATLVKKAFNFANEQLTATFGSIEMDLQKESLFEVEAGVYTGDIDASLAIYTEGGLKRVPLSIAIRASEPVFIEGSENVIKRIATQLTELAGPIDEKLAEYYDKADEKIKQIEAKYAMVDDVTKQIENGADYKTAYANVYGVNKASSFENTAAHYEDKDSGYSTGILMDDIPEMFNVNKVGYPSTMSLGDTINISGVVYKIVDTANQGSSVDGSGGQWILRKSK